MSSDDNIADFFTKSLSLKQFFKLRDQIMNVPSEHQHQSSLRALRAVRADRSPCGSTDGGALNDELGSLTAEVISALPAVTSDTPTAPVAAPDTHAVPVVPVAGPGRAMIDTPRAHVTGMST